MTVSGSSVAVLARGCGALERAHLVRYEDLVRRPEDTPVGAARYLELDAPTAAMDAMAASVTTTRR